jgi:hypothetical protein
MSISREQRQARLQACVECPSLFRPTYTCKECGCFVKVKSALPMFTCPLGKWEPIESEGE